MTIFAIIVLIAVVYFLYTTFCMASFIDKRRKANAAKKWIRHE